MSEAIMTKFPCRTQRELSGNPGQLPEDTGR